MKFVIITLFMAFAVHGLLSPKAKSLTGSRMVRAPQMPPIPTPSLSMPLDASINVILPPVKEKIVLFEYPAGINKSDYLWVVEACDPRQDVFHWHTINSTMDSNKLVTVQAYNDVMVYRVRGIHK